MQIRTIKLIIIIIPTKRMLKTIRLLKKTEILSRSQTKTLIEKRKLCIECL